MLLAKIAKNAKIVILVTDVYSVKIVLPVTGVNFVLPALLVNSVINAPHAFLADYVIPVKDVTPALLVIAHQEALLVMNVIVVKTVLIADIVTHANIVNLVNFV